MADVNTEEGKARFDELVRKAENGETTTITRDGKPVADLVPHAEKPKKKGGTDWEAGYRYMDERGIDKFFGDIPPDFDDPLPEDFLITPLPADFDKPKTPQK
jgi:prevent-host-death family protein